MLEHDTPRIRTWRVIANIKMIVLPFYDYVAFVKYFNILVGVCIYECKMSPAFERHGRIKHPESFAAVVQLIIKLIIMRCKKNTISKCSNIIGANVRTSTHGP